MLSQAHTFWFSKNLNKVSRNHSGTTVDSIRINYSILKNYNIIYVIGLIIIESIPAALRSKTDAGGVLRIKVKLLS